MNEKMLLSQAQFLGTKQVDFTIFLLQFYIYVKYSFIVFHG